MLQPQPNEQPIYSGIPFDPLKYVKRLESVGFSRDQAEVQAETFSSIVQEQFITKHDLKELEVDLKRDIKELEVNLRKDIKELESKTTLEFEIIRRDIKELEINSRNQSELLRRNLKLWFGGMLVTLVALFSGMVTLIPRLIGH